MTERISVDPSTRTLWRTGRGPVLFGLVLVALGVLTAVVATPNRGSLDPRGADRNGSRAVAELLRAEGVDVELVQTRAAASEAATAGSTLLVANPDLLGASQRDSLARTAADVVLLAPGDDALQAFAPELDRAGEARVAAREPRCGLPAAVAAGAAEVGDRLYVAGPASDPTGSGAEIVACYPVDEAAALVQVRTGGRTVTVLGATDPLTNARLAEQGNAALAMRLLGANPRLVWYLPSLTDVPPEDQRSFVDLVPDGWWWGAAQLVAGVLLIAVWRARRLGPVVVEPLPVVVRATETVEGRARLYRRAGARDRAAAELREAALRRLVPMLGLPTAAEPAAVIDALASRTGRSASALGELMYGPAPDRDEALVQLATDLDAVELEVREIVTEQPGGLAMSTDPSAEGARAREALLAVRGEVGKAVVGQDAAVSGLVIGLLCHRHLLLEGVPGVAKTLLVRALAKALALDTKRIQFTPDLMPGDVTGSLVYDARSGQFSFREGPVFTNLLLADEINRTPPKTQASLLEAMEERQVSVEGRPRRLPSPFVVAATQNPVEYEGTYPLPEAQLDRFLLKLVMPLPERSEEVAILQRHAAGFDPLDLDAAGVTAVADRADLAAGQAAVTRVSIAPEVIGYVVDVCRATRTSPSLQLGVSPRGATALLAASRAWAWMSGRDYVTPDDVKALARPALRHRVRLRAEAELEGVTADGVVDGVLATVPVPR